MAKGTAVVMCRNLTQGQLTAVLFVRSMAVKAACGDRFATNFMKLAAKRRWEALAALASLLSNADTAPSPRDFRYALPWWRWNPLNALVLSLKTCCALLALIVIAASFLWLGLLPVQAAGAASATAAPPEKIGPEHPAAATDRDDLTGLLRAIAILELERRTGHEAPSSDYRELLHEMGKSDAEIEATLE